MATSVPCPGDGIGRVCGMGRRAALLRAGVPATPYSATRYSALWPEPVAAACTAAGETRRSDEIRAIFSP